MIKPVKAQPNAGRDDKVALFFIAKCFSSAICELLQRTMQAQIKSHAQRVAAR
jgi:hypothetical protein